MVWRAKFRYSKGHVICHGRLYWNSIFAMSRSILLCRTGMGRCWEYSPPTNVAMRPVFRKPRESFGPIAKSQTLWLQTEPFYSHIFNRNRGSLHTTSFRCIQFSVFMYRWTKNGFTGPKSFRGFWKTVLTRCLFLVLTLLRGFSSGFKISNFQHFQIPISMGMEDPHETMVRPMWLPL